MAASSAVVDCDVHSKIPNDTLIERLPRRWSDYYRDFGYRAPNEIAYFSTRPRGGGAARTDAFPPSGLPPGGDPGFTKLQLLDEWDLEKAVINPIDQLILSSVPVELSAAICSVVNDWTRDAFIEFDPRFLGSILIPYDDAPLALRELERMAGAPGFVQLLVNSRTRDPLGNRRYWPIYERAAELGIPVAAHVGGVAGNTMTGAGWPSYYFEDHSGFSQSFQAQVISLVCEGVFERFPRLRFVIQESGLAWLPPLMWRLDRSWKQLRAEVPHLDRLPSEVIRNHIWFTTQPVEEPERPEYFGQFLEQLDMNDHLLFSSDYPHWDFDAPDAAIPHSLGREVREAIMAGNARRLYGLPEPAPRPGGAGACRMIDCDVHVVPPTIDRLQPYLDGYWREYMREAGFVLPDGPAFSNPPGAVTTRLPGLDATAGCSLESVRSHVLDRPGLELAFLTCDYGIETPRNPGFTAAFARAVNDWLVAEWLDPEPRLRASLVVPVQHPEVAAAEIDRSGGHPGFVQVHFPARGERPYGHQCHDPIYAAALRQGLAIGIHHGGLSINPTGPTGWHTYFLEDSVGCSNVFQSQLTSIIVEGVFSRFPELRISLVESGVTWLPSLLWRLDKEWKGIRREAPWLKRAPSATIRESMRATIAPFDAPDTVEHLQQIVEQIGSEEFLLYASDWPHNHDDGSGLALLDHVPAALAQRIRSTNARDFYRL